MEVVVEIISSIGVGGRRRRGGGREQGTGRTRTKELTTGRTREQLQRRSLRIGLHGTKGYHYGVVITYSSNGVANGDGERGAGRGKL